MTCFNSGILLEGYLDNELSADEARNFEIHLKSCPECQDELEALKQLKEILASDKFVDPGDEYWEENKSLILAKTIESEYLDNSQPTKVTSVKTDFKRALVAVAASLVLLASSLFIGVESDKQLSYISDNNNIFTLNPMQNILDSEQNIIVSEDEQINIVKGMLLISPPGSLGRLTSYYNIYYGEY
jgi:hypothetical protein